MCVQVRLEHFCVGSAGPLNVGPGGGGPPGGSALATAAIAGVSASGYGRGVLGGGDGGDREGEGHGLPAGLFVVLRSGVRHVHSIPTSWHCFNESEQSLISTNKHRFLHATRAPNG
jgi:hypothetical protein